MTIDKFFCPAAPEVVIERPRSIMHELCNCHTPARVLQSWPPEVVTTNDLPTADALNQDAKTKPRVHESEFPYWAGNGE